MTSPTISAHAWTGDPSAASVRLTPLGRLLLAGLIALSACVLLLAAAVSVLSESAPYVQSTAATVVQPPGAALADQGRAVAHTVVAGDTLWDLATGLEPGADPRPLIDRIQQINSMSGSELSPGSVLWLPVPSDAQHPRG